jgi:hypothetical protein
MQHSRNQHHRSEHRATWFPRHGSVPLCTYPRALAEVYLWPELLCVYPFCLTAIDIDPVRTG